MSADEPVIFDADNPEWTDEDFAKARWPEDMPDWLHAAFPKTGRGRPALSAQQRKQPVSIRLDADLVAKLRASGPGWQGRVNDILRKYAL